jgi:hypothetical protein
VNSSGWEIALDALPAIAYLRRRLMKLDPNMSTANPFAPSEGGRAFFG